ncbi:Vacuolar protein sorting-associated protein 9a [Penicillium subrubescens]|uniref:Vacuolar protein sorting-associated protein 9a n=1 Tax=Penicillium subrubescens TaxID=1316194 RepID=A0A1Q5UK49_9EURO|nr:Vacuolar protein sorting-associated protein 9a [Penicillium subrubescens]KAJ5905548.1 Vacuolar protein sorting-associated protein 9a [Penicillium subrubescens]OKP12842.1 Vacuolar protein sorting-associated protein 9a [Penicillium subrubescens]
MSATEPLSPLGSGKKREQPTHEALESPTPATDLPETEHGPSIESSQQAEMGTEPPTKPRIPAGLVDVQTDTAEVSPPSVAAPSQPDRLAGQVEALSLSVKIPESGMSSTANTPPPPPPPEKDDSYLTSNPTAPVATPQPASAPNSGPSSEKELPDVPGDSDPETSQTVRSNGARDDNDSQPEIQNIMGQFQDPARTTDQEEIMSPRLELAEQFRTSQHFPPRRSSLEPVHSPSSGPSGPAASHSGPAAPAHHRYSVGPEDLTLTRQSSASTLPPPPEPEPDQPFDFHRFLEQLRHRTADPVAKFLRSFLTEFAKKQWMAHEQVKIISDFLAFITNKMAICEIWRDVSDAEFDNAKEGMEKLVMNRLYSQTFSPAIPAPPTIPRSTSRSRRREIEKLHGPWRRGQHQEDIERDDILAQKIRIYSWVKEEHLDIAAVSGSGRRFLSLAQQELLKINGYRAPRDKVICILNCCKVIFGLLRNSRKADTSADSFVPLLIYVVLHANPGNLVSNIQYILRFRNQEKLGGEAGYYLSSLSGAIQFIETLDRTSLTVSDEDFERNVEAAVSAIAEQNREHESLSEKSPTQPTAPSGPAPPAAGPSRRDASQSDDDTSAPVAGLLRTIQKPLSTIGRIFSDDADSSPSSAQDRPLQPATTPQPGIAPPRLTPNVYQPPRASSEGRRSGDERPAPPREKTGGAQKNLSRVLDAQDAAARQASAEEAEAQRIQRAEHNNVVETLSNMFPNLDRDVIDDVVKQKEGRVGLAVDACLALSAE